MAKRKVGVIALLLALVMVFSSAFACGGKKEEKVDPNETKPLVLQTSTMDGVFNPFFSSSAYDRDVYSLVTTGLLTNDATGAIVAGDEYATVAKSYEVIENADGSVSYEVVIKNGLKFSDGTAVTADDVLFAYYVLLDPKYDGNTTMYTQPIVGLSEYRNQTTPDKAKEYGELAGIAWDLGYGLSETDFNTAIATVESEYDLTYADYQAYWSDAALQTAGEKFAQDIVSYVLGKYMDYLADYFYPFAGSLNDTQKVAFGMIMWGFAEVTSDTYAENENGNLVYVDNVYEAYDENKEYADDTEYFNLVDGEYVATAYDDYGNPQVGDFVRVQKAGYVKYDATEHAGMTRYDLNTECIVETGAGKEVDVLSSSAVLTVADYWDALKAGYADDEGVVDYATLSGTEAANIGLDDCLKEVFIPAKAQLDGGEPVKSISGIVKGKKTIDGKEYETITITCEKKNPKTILELGVTVVPKAYYTKGWTYTDTDDVIINAGVEFNNAKFMAHLKTKNSLPMGAGPYKFVSYTNNVVEFTRNEYFATFGLGNAKIKTIRMQVISGGQEYDAVKSGTVHYATASATADVVSEVSTINRLTAIFVDNLGYGYICINPAVYKNLNTRIALQTVFDLSLVYEYYPNGLAEIIYRGMSKVSWAYPEGSEAIYDYDKTAALARQYFEEAGYTWDGDTMIDPDTGEQAVFEFYIPSNASDHPAGKIFQNVKTILDGIGANARVKVDTSLISKINDGKIGVYALAWQAALDPDMTQVYHMDSQADSVIANGIKYIVNHPEEFGEEAGTITFKGNTYSQYEALVELSRLISEGLDYMKPADRKPIYKDALDLLAEMVIELPTYQRKNLFVYDNSVIDANSLSANVTPYWGPMAEIWKVSFVQGK